ncbi:MULTISPECIES: hypothetical protein [unclassified Acinetobacter]|uniref:cell division protein BlhA n=1 Tax=unclassified Acinetobacter TaxID=196816 RepID=UPI00190C28F6|nr:MULTISPECIES: hypothetical protein [unclassified Acinetobacter]MBK0064693.1 hypothetical protein [Acinetobacter sp. S55]MBK0068069.1 hypothetical protein [Acinetobacter sp. S54]
MALNVGQDFKKRWLNAPEMVRQTYQDDLARICDLLQPQTTIETWAIQNQKAQEASFDKIKQAYADLKAELIERARIRRQQALEQSLAQKREQQAQYAASLQADEIHQFQQQTHELIALRSSIQEEIESHTARYHQNPDHVAIDYSHARHQMSDDQIQSELESLRLRLELEADSLIEQAVTVFRAKLYTAAQEEIEYILKSSDL